MKSIKIVIIGAGSASFGLSSLATLLREPTLRGSTLALVDLNAEGLRLVHQLAERMNRTWGSGLTIESNTDRRVLLDGAKPEVLTSDNLSAMFEGPVTVKETNGYYTAMSEGRDFS